MRKWYLGIALLSLLLVHALILARIEPVVTYFYIFVWWSYIFTVDSLIFWLRGASLFSQLKAKTLLLVFSSYFFWEFFELINLRIANWSYGGSPPNWDFLTSSAWEFGFRFLAFGSVLPSVLETHSLLQFLGIGKRLEFLGWEKISKFFGQEWWGRPYYLWQISGLAMLIVSLIWPKYFFWMVWLALIFLLDPGVEKNGGQSLFSDLRRRHVRTLYRLLGTGLICGVLWEGWNYWAGLKWTYDVPFGSDLKIFEMPVLGYLGFSAFALECYIFWEWLCCHVKIRGRVT